MSIRKKMTWRGILMLVPFFLLLVDIFSPIFPGKVNGLDYIDNLFNMISKGSSYFIPAYLEKSGEYNWKEISASIAVSNEKQLKAIAGLFIRAGGNVEIKGEVVEISGDMGQILKASLQDADFMFHNDNTQLREKYGYKAQEVVFNWWTAYKGMIKDLTRQKRFEDAKVCDAILQKALEPAYNYRGIESGSYRDNFLLISGVLLFYIVYTLWYGFGIMYLFEGAGLRVGH